MNPYTLQYSQSCIIILLLIIAPCWLAAQNTDSIDALRSEQYQEKLTALECDIYYDRIEQLESQVEKLKTQRVIIEIDWAFISPLLILISSLLILRWFRIPVMRLMTNFAKRINTSNIKIYGIELSSHDVGRIYTDRETLRIGIEIAFSDGEFNPTEGQFIHTMAGGMDDDLQSDLSDNAKQKIIKTAIRVALADKDFKMGELTKIQTESRKIGLDAGVLDSLILELCIQQSVIPPTNGLRERYFEIKESNE